MIRMLNMRIMQQSAIHRKLETVTSWRIIWYFVLSGKVIEIVAIIVLK